jgi:hypothetical protein
MITIEKWKLWAFFWYTVYLMVSMYGHGLTVTKAEYQDTINDIGVVMGKQNDVIQTQRFLIDKLMIESGRESIYNTEEEMDVIWDGMLNNEVFNKENWLDG